MATLPKAMLGGDCSALQGLYITEFLDIGVSPRFDTLRFLELATRWITGSTFFDGLLDLLEVIPLVEELSLIHEDEAESVLIQDLRRTPSSSCTRRYSVSMTSSNI